MRFRMTSACLLPVVLAYSAALQAESFSRKVDPWVLQKSSAGTAEFLVMLRTQGDLRGARALSSKTERSAFVMDALRSVAEHSQKPLLDLLASRGVPHRSYWVANMIWVRGDRSLVEELAPRDDVRAPLRQSLRAPPRTGGSAGGPGPSRPTPSSGASPRSARRRSGRAGFTGQGVVVGGQDTGYDWDHPALKSKYRGWNGATRRPQLQLARRDPHRRRHPAARTRPRRATTTATARTRWARWSATTAAPTRSAWRPARSGSAAATWTRASARRRPTPSASSGSSPRRTSANQNPDPSKAPDVINNSWGCPPERGLHGPQRPAGRRREHARGRHRRRRLGRQQPAPAAAPWTIRRRSTRPSFSRRRDRHAATTSRASAAAGR